jgi:ABC-2 type transport system ATP-binding protein
MTGLTVARLDKCIDGKRILRQLGFQLQKGEIVGLVGRNGAGKTTLFQTLVHQYIADGGVVQIDDQDTVQRPELRAQMVFIDGQNLFFGHYTLLRLADFYQQAYPQFNAARYADLLREYKLNGQRTFGELSKGYRALVCIFLALASGAPYVLLDEPFDGLDAIVREQIVKLVISEVAEHQTAFLIASHNLEELDGLADRVLFLKGGTITHDYKLEELRQQAVKLQLVFPVGQVPDIVQSAGKIIATQGRVLTVVFANYTPEVAAAVSAAQPVLQEELALDLVDLFKAEYIHPKNEEVLKNA